VLWGIGIPLRRINAGDSPYSPDPTWAETDGRRLPRLFFAASLWKNWCKSNEIPNKPGINPDHAGEQTSKTNRGEAGLNQAQVIDL
jgi:hypothetical protein